MAQELKQKIDVGNLVYGTRVHYNPEFGQKQNGIVKSLHITKQSVFVVYKCAGDWKNFNDYTAELTDVSDLKQGWI